MACTVLAIDPSFRGEASATLPNMDPETETRRRLLANACRLMETAGEKSPMALGMVRRLLRVLRRFYVHGVGREVSDDMVITRAPSPGQVASYAAAEGPSNFTVEQQQQMTMMQPSSSGDVQMPSVVQDQADWTYEEIDPDGLTGIWNDFLGTKPTDYRWGQLFSELDHLGGPF